MGVEPSTQACCLPLLLGPSTYSGMPWGRKGGESLNGWPRVAGQGWSQVGLRRRRQPSNNQVLSRVATLGELEQLQNEFESFLSVVNQDIEAKTEYWSVLKKGEVERRASRGELGRRGKKLETYASIQRFMLRRYSKRISRFLKASVESLRRICEVCSSEGERERAEELIDTHVHILVKMKRRLKHMMDVSDKYFLTDLADTLHLLGQATSELAPPIELERYMSSPSSCSSFDDLSTSTSYLSLSSPSISYISSSSASSTAPPHPKLRPFRSLLDQLVVLGKTYTE